jgi:hypothetical protein
MSSVPQLAHGDPQTECPSSSSVLLLLKNKMKMRVLIPILIHILISSLIPVLTPILIRILTPVLIRTLIPAGEAALRVLWRWR